MAPSVAPELIGQVRLDNLPILRPFQGVRNQDFISRARVHNHESEAGQVEVIGSHSWAMSCKNKISHTLESSCLVNVVSVRVRWRLSSTRVAVPVRLPRITCGLRLMCRFDSWATVGLPYQSPWPYHYKRASECWIGST